MTAKKYDYWLCSIAGIGNHTIARLLAEFETAQGIYEAPAERLRPLLKRSQAVNLEEQRRVWDLNGEYESLKRREIHFLTRGEARYPARLKNIPDAPYGIFYKGSLPEESCLSVAIIGARECSEYGRYIATRLGAFLGENKVQVVSGMARGIDSISQEAVLAAGGMTTAVLGSGVDVCYPQQNRKLYEKIQSQGCLLSAYSPGTLPKPGNFPPRNRIVSGLADAVVVVEARERSGTLITVDMALEQGREVYVVPGRITDRLSDGCNRLLKQGAGIFLSPADFLTEISETWRRSQINGEICADTASRNGEAALQDRKGTIRKDVPLQLRKLYDCLDFSPRSAEQIKEALAEENGAEAEEVSSLNIGLMKLCVLGFAKQEMPGYFTLHISSNPL